MSPLMHMPSTVYVWIGSSLLWKVQFVLSIWLGRQRNWLCPIKVPIKLHTCITDKMTYHNIMSLFISSFLWILQFHSRHWSYIIVQAHIVRNALPQEEIAERIHRVSDPTATWLWFRLLSDYFQSISAILYNACCSRNRSFFIAFPRRFKNINLLRMFKRNWRPRPGASRPLMR